MPILGAATTTLDRIKVMLPTNVMVPSYCPPVFTSWSYILPYMLHIVVLSLGTNPRQTKVQHHVLESIIVLLVHDSQTQQSSVWSYHKFFFFYLKHLGKLLGNTLPTNLQSGQIWVGLRILEAYALNIHGLLKLGWCVEYLIELAKE